MALNQNKMNEVRSMKMPPDSGEFSEQVEYCCDVKRSTVIFILRHHLQSRKAGPQ